MSELNSSTNSIDPYLNAAHWDGKEIGGEAPPPWPVIEKPTILELGIGMNFLSTYSRQGASRLALVRFEPGQVFSADDFAHGTIFLSAVESVDCNSGKSITPMSQFANLPLPDKRPGLADEKQKLSGHGYTYSTRHWINVITGGRVGVCLIDPTRVQAGEPNKEDLLQGLEGGIRTYTVGDTYNFGSNDRSVLIRVDELIICMHGLKPKGKSIRGRLFDGAGKLATES